MVNNREIEFRAWDDGLMVYFDNISKLTHKLGIIEKLAMFFYAIRDDAIIMQYTGFKDQHGKKIFEGDIVKFHTFRYVIKYVNGAFIAYHYNGLKDFDGSDLKWGGIWKFVVNGFDMEIDSNIYENP